MDTVRQWALTAAVSAVVGAVICLLSPKGAMNKSVRTAVSIFMLAALISPFTKGIELSEFTADLPKQAEGVDLSEAVVEEMRLALEKKIRAILSDTGIKSADINIDISIDPENSMTVDDIRIEAYDVGEKSVIEAEKAIKEEIGADVKIEVRE